MFLFGIELFICDCIVHCSNLFIYFLGKVTHTPSPPIPPCFELWPMADVQ